MNHLEITLGSDAYSKIKYPAGELQIRLSESTLAQICSADEVTIVARLAASEQIIELCLLMDAINAAAKRNAAKTLVLPYLPYARADRRFVEGDCFGIEVFGKLLNSLEVTTVTLDVHSDKASQHVPKLIAVSAMPLITQAITSFASRFSTSNLTILFPDEGARKRYNIPETVNGISTTVLHCSKKRDQATGKFIGFSVPERSSFPETPVLIIDDICDGGGTFLGIAEAMSDYKLPLGLYITHGIFSKGLAQLEQKFRVIYTTDSFREWESTGMLEVITAMPLLAPNRTKRLANHIANSNF